MSGRRGSNPRPSAWEADALPTELFPPGVNFLFVYLKNGYKDINILCDNGKISTYKGDTVYSKLLSACRLIVCF